MQRPGTLFVVATPIGNLGDLSPRALDTLKKVSAVCAEDTRHTRQLLSHFGVDRPLVALHEDECECAAGGYALPPTDRPTPVADGKPNPFAALSALLKTPKDA